jgi:predicted ribosome quality control (RQC) complex YloA/Tae2 family protein
MPIGLDGLGIALLVRELRDILTGRVIQSIRLNEARVLTITLAKPGAGDIRFLAEPAFPLLALGKADRASRPTQEPPAMPRFEEPLVGRPVSGVEQVDLDRVVKLVVGGRTGDRFHLYFELIPPHPNVFLTNGDDGIVATLFKAGTRTRKRTLTRGKQYVPPVSQDKADPYAITAEHLEALPWRDDWEVLSRAIHGVGPFLSREIVNRAEYLESLAKAFSETIGAHRRGKLDPGVSTIRPDVARTPPWIGVTWYKPGGPWVESRASAASLSTAVNGAINEFTITAGRERDRASLIKYVTREIKKWKKAELVAEKAEGDREAGERFRKFGEIIVANLKSVIKGKTEVSLPDIFSEAAADITIPLEPHLSPNANAEAYFKKARKAMRRAELAQGNLTAARSRLQELRTIRQELTSGDIAARRIEEIRKQFADTAHAAKKETIVDEKAERLGIRPRRYVITDGWTVLVGRSARENDILTHRYATPGDMWFHARQAQGSHVVLKRGRKKKQVSRQAILEAAGIAAHFSKARTSKHVPVSYTEKRYVKKVRKGPPGLCVMLREKVVFVDPALPS